MMISKKASIKIIINSSTLFKKLKIWIAYIWVNYLYMGKIIIMSSILKYYLCYIYKYGFN